MGHLTVAVAKTLMLITDGLQVFVVHLVQAGWSFLSRMVSAGSDHFRVGFHLLVKNGEGAADHSLDEHPDQNAFRRPIGEGAIDLASDTSPFLFVVLPCIP